MPLQVKSVLWVDDEAELLEPHRIFLRDKGFDVEAATNAEDAMELVRRRAFDLVLLDEQMPGTRGLDALKELHEIQPSLQIVMVTKSEEDGTLTEALGKNTAGYLVKPVTPRQVYAVVARLLEGPRIRQQAVARAFVDRFRVMQGDSPRDFDWRAWIDRYLEMVQWDLDLTAANEMGLHESLRGLFPELRRDFAAYMAKAYPAWLADLEGDRPPLSVDIVSEYLIPVIAQDKAAAFIVIDCLRLDQWKFLEPVIAPLFDIETTHYFGVLPTATPYARNALFSGLFPNEIAARF
ncbi:MAG: response regulator receiver, partial [Gemmatimonadetes bacterium]|nr:response regulator receiver [Gemmatimonadota bacterium]